MKSVIKFIPFEVWLLINLCKSSGSDVQSSRDKIYDSHIQSTDYIFIMDLEFLMLTDVFKRHLSLFHIFIV
jgi:hypothetical protein